MKKKLFTLLIALSAIAFCWADEGGFTVKNIDFYGSVSDNNVVSAREKIEVNFTEQRHGIYRTIPQFYHFSYYGEDGEKIITKEYHTDVQSIDVSNAKASCALEDGNCVIKIGDADRTVIGLMNYNISYDYIFPDDRITDFDYFYYSVLGSQWETPVEHFTFRVDFPNGIPEGTEFSVFSGDFGSYENKLNATCTVEGNSVYGELSDVPAGNAVTLFAYLPEGYFVGIKKVSSLPAWILFILSCAASVLLVAYLLTRKQEKPVQTVEFYPPEGVPPAEVGMIIDNSADSVDLVALIPWWASKGLLKIESETEKKLLGTKTKMTVTKLKALEDSAPDYQKKLWDALFTDGNSCDLNELPSDFGDDFNKAKEELTKKFSDTKELYQGAGKALLISIASSVLVGVALMLNSPISYFENFMAIYPASAAVVAALIMSKAEQKKNFNRKNYIKKLVLSALLNLFVILIYFWAISEDEAFISLELTLIPLVLNAVAAILSPRMMKMSEYNIQIAGKLMGLKEFIRTAEYPKLKALSDENPEYFYNILPYAMVFDLSTKWGEKFKDIDVRQPSWWSDPYYLAGTYSTLAITKSISESMNTALNTVSSASSAAASSSSGGGFSGGGGGGGGGGSW